VDVFWGHSVYYFKLAIFKKNEMQYVERE